MIPEMPSIVAAPVVGIALVFILDWRMGLASLITVPVSALLMVGMIRGFSGGMSTYLRSGAAYIHRGQSEAHPGVSS